MDQKSAQQWNQQLFNQPTQAGIFLQSHEWGNFLECAGKQILRFEFEGMRILIEVKSLPFGFSYWYVARAEISEDVFLRIMAKAQDAGVVFVRFEPMGEWNRGVAVKSVQPHQTHVIDVAKEDESLLQAMHSKTRYNVRLASKRGVEVVFDHDGEYADDFMRLIEVTRLRNSFGIHDEDYYQMQIVYPSSFLVVAKYGGEVIAAHVYWVFGDTLTYLHGASANVHRNVMAPHGIHFNVMQWAREQGLKYYDMWGIDEDKWTALTRFKRGFGGEDVSYAGCFDVPVRKGWYWVYRLVRRLKG